MSNQINRIVSDFDHITLSNYLHLTPENRLKVTAYLEELAASQCTPAPFSDFQR